MNEPRDSSDGPARLGSEGSKESSSDNANVTADNMSLIESMDGRADNQFLDDLSAAVRFKSFLVGRGRPVSSDVSKGLGKLVSLFAAELEEFERQTRDREQPTKRNHVSAM
jgi:hypothetical protein